jgi:hypothetical protein
LAPKSAITNWEDEHTLGTDVDKWNYQQVIADSVELQSSSFSKRIEPLKNILWMTLLDVYNPQPSTTAFDSLVNSGELGILQNEKLVRQLQHYRNFTSGLLGAQNLTYRPARDSAVEIGQLYGLSAFGQVNEDEFIGLMNSNLHLAATIQTQLVWARKHFVIMSVLRDEAKTALELIEENLRTKIESTK